MSQGLVPLNQAQMPAAMVARMQQAQAHNSHFADGLRDSFPTISIKGKAFTFKQGQTSQQLLDQNGYALPFLDLVLIDGSKYINKVYYAKGFTDGDADAPDCWSLDSVRPDPSVQNKQNAVCGTCQWNQFGSRITSNGKQAKACSDSRRIAVVMPHHMDQPEPIIPMMRIPQSSLKALKQYAENLARHGWDVNGCLTRVSFDPNEAYPKLRFEFAGGLTDQQYARAIELTQDVSVASMLSAPISDSRDDEGGQPALPQGPNAAPAQYANSPGMPPAHPAPPAAPQVHPAYAAPQAPPAYAPPPNFAPQPPAPQVAPQNYAQPAQPDQGPAPVAQPVQVPAQPQQVMPQNYTPPAHEHQGHSHAGGVHPQVEPPAQPAAPAALGAGVIHIAATGQYYNPAAGTFCNPDGSPLGHTSVPTNPPAAQVVPQNYGTPAPAGQGSLPLAAPVSTPMVAPDPTGGGVDMTAAQAEQVRTWQPGDPIPGQVAEAKPKARKPRATTPTPPANDTAAVAPAAAAAPPGLDQILAGLLPSGQQ